MGEREYEKLAREAEAREKRVEEGGGTARIARQRRLGRMTARQRIGRLVDAGTFVELGRHVTHRHAHASEQLAANRHPGDGVIAGFGEIGGRRVALYAHDPTILRGALGHAASRKVCHLLDLALERRIPVVTLADSDGVRVEEGIDGIEAYGEILRRTVRLRRTVPQVTVVFGLCVGAAAYAAALNDFVGMVAEQSYLFITGPKVTKVVTGEDVELAELGGAKMHATRTGQCHAILADDGSAIEWVKTLLAFLEPTLPSRDAVERRVLELESIVPLAERRAYDMRKVVRAIFDESSLLELSPSFAPNLLTVLARLGGRRVAVVASQPMVHAGCLDIDASRKGAAFVTWASDNGVPVVTLVDTPGYLPGRKQEEGGILPHGATLIDAYGSAKVPLVCLVVRKSFGGASVLSFAADVRLGLPTARIGSMGVDATLEVVLGPELDGMGDEAKRAREAKRAEWIAANDHAWAAAEAGYLDRVIMPADARAELSRTLHGVER
jgi:acetyl-CoA carboxylase carboxyltransferase component